MSFQEDLNEFLDVKQGFAVTAVLHPALGEEYVITGNSRYSNNYTIY